MTPIFLDKDGGDYKINDFYATAPEVHVFLVIEINFSM